MKQDEFLAKLMGELGDLREVDREQIREYYNELICDGIEQGREEENIIAGFGTPESIALKAKKDHEEYNQLMRSTPSSNTKPQFETDLPVHTIIVEAQNIRINVRPVSSGTVRVLFQPREVIDHVSFSVENGEFIFRHNMQNFLLSWLHMFHLPQVITLELPSHFAGNLRVKSSNAAVTVSGLTNLSNGQFITSNSRIAVENIACSSLLIQTSNGGLNVSNLIGDQLEAVTSNSRISAFSCKFPNGLLLSTKNGGIDGKCLDSDKIVLQTSNSAITGSIIGDMRDYAIQSHTSNGSCNLPNCAYPDQKKHLLVRTSNGRIKVEFVQ